MITFRRLVFLAFLQQFNCMFDQFTTKGLWEVKNIYDCPNPEEYQIDLGIYRRKINRTHDAFSISTTLPETITDTSHGVIANVCKYMDGGCRPFYDFDAESFCNFTRQYAKENFYNVMKLAGNDDCPVPKGHFGLDDYVFNYEELPEAGSMVGEYTTTVYLIKDNIRVSCFQMDLRFKFNGNEE